MRRVSKGLAFILCGAFSVVCAQGVRAQTDWVQWRGPARDGVVRTNALPAAWPKELARKYVGKSGSG